MAEEPRTSKFVKRPIVVEAWRIDHELMIPTLEGDMRASTGDWIVTGVKGEQYPVKPDIFEATYEPVTLTEAAVLYRDKAALKEVEVYIGRLEGILARAQDFLLYRDKMNAALHESEVRYSPLTASVLAGREYLGRLKGSLTWLP